MMPTPAEVLSALRRPESDLEKNLRVIEAMWGTPVRQMQVSEARQEFTGIVRTVAQTGEVILIRNAQRPGEPGVMIVAETRLVGAAARGGISLAQVIENFKRSPVKVHSTDMTDETDEVDDPLQIGTARTQAAIKVA